MMKKTLIALCCLACALILTGAKKAAPEPLSSLTPEEIRHIEETTWRIELKANIKNTYIEAVQFSVFEQDPLPVLQNAWKERIALNQGKTITAFDRQINHEVDWDSVFDTISGRDVFLIKAKTGKNDSPIISANTENGTKWVVTKVSHKKDGSFAVWIIPFTAQKGQLQTIELTDKNTFDINTLQGV